MKIDIVGWFNKSNIGDEAFKYFHQRCFGRHNLTYVTPPASCTDSDIVILGGGAVVAPYYLDILPKDKPKYALGVDIAYESEMDLLAAANFQGVMVRNATDIPTLEQKLHCPVRAIPDLAFIIEPRDYKINPTSQKKMGILVTDYVNPAIDRSIDLFAKRAFDFKTKIAKQLDRFIKDGWQVYLIPCSTGGYGNDIRINLDLCAFMERDPICIMEALKPPEMIGLLKQMDVNICMRFHAHIFSIMAGTPFVSIDFTRKVKLLLKENGLSELSAARFEGDVFTHNLDLAIEKALGQNYPELFNQIAEAHKTELENVKKQVQADWLGEP